MQHRWFLVPTVLVVLAAGCTGGGPLRGPDDAGGTGAAVDASEASPDPGADALDDAPAGCGGPARPCDPAEVAPDVAARVDELYADLDALLGSGASMPDLLAMLREQPDVLEAGAGPDALRFHVEGAVPSWYFVRTSAPVVGAPPPATGAPLAMTAPQPGPGITVDRDSEEKSALLLSPFDWEWELRGVPGGTGPHERTLDRTRDYDGRVVQLADRLADPATIRREVPLSVWETFDQHDYVHVFTHGGYWCDEDPLPDIEDCTNRRVGLLTMTTPEELSGLLGQPGDGEQDSVGDAVLRSGGLEVGRVGFQLVPGADPGRLPNVPEAPFAYEPVPSRGPDFYGAGHFVVLTADYFRAAYPQGLTDTVVVLTSCNAGGDSDLQRVLAGEGSVVFGWSRTVLQTVGVAAAQRIAELLVDRDDDIGEEVGGFRATTVLDRLVEEVGSIPGTDVVAGVLRDVETEALLGVVGDEDARAREVPFLLDDEGDELREEGIVEVVGQPGDGEPDRIELVVEVDGLADDVDAATLDLSLAVDEATTYDVQQRLDQQADRSRWRTTFGVDLDRDLDPGRRIDLRVEVQLPDGFSAWTYEQLRPCGVTPDGNRIPFPLPDGASYVGPEELPSVHRYVVPSYDAALAHLGAAIAADPDHTQIDDPGISRLGDLRDAGFTLVGPCYDLAGGFSLQEQEDGSVTLDVLDLG